MRISLFIAFMVLVHSVSVAQPEIKGTPSELTGYLSSLPKEVVLDGESQLEVIANQGVVTLCIKTKNNSLKQALTQNQNLRQKVSSLIMTAGIPQERITGASFSSTPEYGYSGKKPNNYIVENLLKITVESEIEFQHVAGIVDQYNDVFYQGIELKDSEKNDIKTRVLNMALKDAQTRQHIYEKELGLILKPVSFGEKVSVDRMPLRNVPLPTNGKMSDNSSSVSISFDADMEKSNISLLGNWIYYGNVTITYQVVSK